MLFKDDISLSSESLQILCFTATLVRIRLSSGFIYVYICASGKLHRKPSVLVGYKLELMMNYRSEGKSIGRVPKNMITWDGLIRVSPAIFRNTFLLLFAALLLWLQLKYEVISFAFEMLFRK